MAEKTANELPRELRLLFTKGNDALSRENYDYAIDLFNQVLSKEPSVFDCRKSLRNAQLRKAGHEIASGLAFVHPSDQAIGMHVTEGVQLFGAFLAG